MTAYDEGCIVWKNNPFSIVFGKEQQMYVKNSNQFDEIRNLKASFNFNLIFIPIFVCFIRDAEVLH